MPALALGIRVDCKLVSFIQGEEYREKRNGCVGDYAKREIPKKLGVDPWRELEKIMQRR